LDTTWIKHTDRHPRATERAGIVKPADFQNHRGQARAAAWLDARRIRLLAFDNHSNIAVGRS
jgi:hypothetical protein